MTPPRPTTRPHKLGPRRSIVGWLYDGNGFPYTLLECGHALRFHRYNKESAIIPRQRSCSVCEDREVLSDFKLQRCIEDVEAARLEGKRQRLIAHLKAQGKEIPERAQRRRSRIALYETREEIPHAS